MLDREQLESSTKWVTTRWRSYGEYLPLCGRDVGHEELVKLLVARRRVAHLTGNSISGIRQLDRFCIGEVHKAFLFIIPQNHLKALLLVAFVS